MERLGNWVVLTWGWRRALLAFASGALLVLAFAPFDFFAVGFVSFPILVWLLDGATADADAGPIRRLIPAFAAGWWFGFGFFVAGLWWIGNALLVEAESFAWALPLAVLALPAALAIFYGLAAVLARLVWSDSLGRIAALAVSFALIEWLRGTILTGFPWNAVGYAGMPTPMLMQSSVLFGMNGMNALTVFVFAMPAMAVSSRFRWVGYALATLLVVGHAGFGMARLWQAETSEKTVPVRFVQPSILQDQKWDRAARDRIFGTYLSLSAQPPSDGKPAPELIIWPETAVPFILNDRPDALATLGDLLADGQTLLVGAVRSEEAGATGETRYYNSVVQIGDAGQILGAVDKVHLVPFGEYMPLASFFRSLGVEKIVALPEDFSSGITRRPLQLGDGLKAAAFICYEIIFDSVVSRDVMGSDIVVNLTNDAWFGDTAGPYQHFRQAQVRAVETGVPLLRSANNGISAGVDGYGRIVDAYGINAVGALDIEMPLGKAESLRPWDRMTAGWAVIGGLALIGGAGAAFSRRRN